jgi:phospholipase C
MSAELTRRGFIAGTLAAAAGLATAGRLMAAEGPSRESQMLDLEHVVIMLQENRSFDHYFGTRRDVRGFVGTDYASLTANGWMRPYHRAPDASSPHDDDPPHGWDAQHAAWNDGRCDRFGAKTPFALGHLEPEDIPYYTALADEYTLCDSYFCSVIGATLPNRLIELTGTIDPQGSFGGPGIRRNSAGFTWETYPERLQRAGISWRVYHGADDLGNQVLPHFRQYFDASPTSDLVHDALMNRPWSAFADDVASGQLPQVSWIITQAAQSEHPPFEPAPGEHAVAQQLAALMTNPAVWAKTAFILTYDENGGFFDHVSPPTPDPDDATERIDGAPVGLGFRVPAMVISPWTRRRPDAPPPVASTVFDHSSILRLLETRFGVEAPLISPWRRATCGDLLDVFDFDSFDPTIPTLPATAERAARFTRPQPRTV